MGKRFSELFAETVGKLEAWQQSALVPSFLHRVLGPIRHNEDVYPSIEKTIQVRYGGYCTAARRYEFYFGVAKRIFYEQVPRVSKLIVFNNLSRPILQFSSSHVMFDV